MGNKDTCLFYKSASPVGDLKKIAELVPDTPDVTKITVNNPTSNPTMTLSEDQYAQVAKMVLDTAKKQTATQESSEQNPVLAWIEGLWKSKPESATPAVPDVNVDAVMGKDSGNSSSTQEGGIHPGLIGGGVALAGGGLLIAYLEALKVKRRRRKEKERMRNMNSNIANV